MFVKFLVAFLETILTVLLSVLSSLSQLSLRRSPVTVLSEHISLAETRKSRAVTISRNMTYAPKAFDKALLIANERCASALS
jgi:hypothetical protein